MKISELAERAGVPVPTVKFYIREGLLAPGELTSKNQASYTEAHLERLDLVRALKEDAGMSVVTIARVLANVDAPRDRALAGGLRALDGAADGPLDEAAADTRAARKLVATAAKAVGWASLCDNAAVDDATRDAVRALLPIQRAFPWIEADDVIFYARTASEIARFEIPDDWDPAGSPGATLKYALLGTYLFEPLILALRRVAHAQRSTTLQDARAREAKKDEAGSKRRAGAAAARKALRPQKPARKG